MNAQNGESVCSYVWNLDPGGFVQEVGGSGGLFWVTHQDAFAVFDGNGNVMNLVSAFDGSLVVRYEYSSFAEPLGVISLLAIDNSIHFCFKYTDSEIEQIPVLQSGAREVVNKKSGVVPSKRRTQLNVLRLQTISKMQTDGDRIARFLADGCCISLSNGFMASKQRFTVRRFSMWRETAGNPFSCPTFMGLSEVVYRFRRRVLFLALHPYLKAFKGRSSRSRQGLL